MKNIKTTTIKKQDIRDILHLARKQGFSEMDKKSTKFDYEYLEDVIENLLVNVLNNADIISIEKSDV